MEWTRRDTFFFGCLVVWVVAVGYLTVANVYAAGRGDPKVPVTTVELPGDFEDISWAATPVPVDAVALASPERLTMASDMLASMLSDPTFRYQVQLWYEHYLSLGHERELASAMAKGQAAQIAYGFADAMLN